MKKILIIFCIAAIVLMAHSQPQYQVRSTYQATNDTGATVTVYVMCSPSVKSCQGVTYADPSGSGKLPPVGATCSLIGNKFDCGCGYKKLYVQGPPV
jgi:hypothetical protein